MDKEKKSKGYIYLSRSLTDNWIWKEERVFNQAEAWIDILMEANHCEKKVCIGGVLINCKRGQSVKSMITWGKRWGWNRLKVRRFLKLLESDTMVVLKTNSKTTILTVCNYDTYQKPWESDEHQMNNKRTSNEHQTNTNNTLKELKTLKEGELTLDLTSEKFLSSWQSWVDYRKEIKKPMKPTTIKTQIKTLSKFSEDEAIKAIHDSIQNGWTGLFPKSAKDLEDEKTKTRNKNLSNPC